MRMGRFAEAHQSIDRAIQLLTSEDVGLASAYSTKGMIFGDSGDDVQAVEWLHRATIEREKHPSPNLESIADDLTREIAALNRLGRADEAAVTEASLANVRARISEIPKSNLDATAGNDPVEGAVTIEITQSNPQVRLADNIKFKKLMLSLQYDAEEQQAGDLSGCVSVPGATTLLFYGRDADALFRALEPRLLSNPVAAGAVVTIRQGETKREVLIPGQSERLN
jgi:hypothetical protein